MKKIIPPFLFLFCIIVMVLLDQFIPSPAIIPVPFNYAGVPILIFGMWMTANVRKMFKNVSTEIHTFKRPQRLVTTGLFAHTRNPIYLGFSLGLLGVWLILSTLLPALGVIFFVTVANFWYIPVEEKALRERFGSEYSSYASRVRRWV